MERKLAAILVVDVDGYVTESPGFNVFLVRDQQVLTPDRGVLEGITRQSILELCDMRGIKASLVPLRRSDMLEADKMFCATQPDGTPPLLTTEILTIRLIDRRRKRADPESARYVRLWPKADSLGSWAEV
jgi:hypothetical protein